MTVSDLHTHGVCKAVLSDVRDLHKQRMVGVQGHAEGCVGGSIASTCLQRSLAAAGGICVLLTAFVAPAASSEVLWGTMAVVCTAFVVSFLGSMSHHYTAKQC
jgi:hypothetical protein